MEFKIIRIVLNAFSRLEMTLAETLVGLQIENVLKNAPQTVVVEAIGCTGKV